MAITERPARIAGWITIASERRGKEAPLLGGLVDISRTGARLYLGWETAVGDQIPLALKVPGNREIIKMPCRVVWVRKDEPGSLSSFEARLKLMRDLARLGYPPKGMVYGWMCGVRFTPGVATPIIRVIQKHLEEESDRRPGGAALTMQPVVEVQEAKFWQEKF
jgi:hypothetical protein